MHDSLTIANRFLEIATEKGDTLTPMQLLKLVYIAHGWMLGLYGVPLIVDEVQAWKYGPVIPSLYKAISKNRDQPVRGPLSCQRQEQLVEVENSLIKQVFDIYGSRSVRWCRFLRQGHKVDRPMKRTIRYE
ncbi:type II toxin-antitoxin system antitoxin SocA domain-containing protein, partial [Nitrobacter sp.]|uniref:Panacea domain-containing protein n=1 Tax=Nitrobacter sp. TaxID=29420 RepID=UPI00321F96CE